ncbi:MAG: HAD family phosphatase [Clostridia bacterium]|nr:HAD family phosphatase [Clostridia bacterium]
MKLKAVIFDMDGVIFDSERASFQAWKELSVKYGFEENFDANYYSIIGTNRDLNRKLFKEYYGADFPYDDYADEKQEICRQRYSNGRMPKKTGITELLEYLKSLGIYTAVASSTYSDIVTTLMDEAGLRSYFTLIVGGDMITRCKPDPEIFLKSIDGTGLKPEECAVIEDSYNGIRAAYAAGMFPIMVPDMLPPTDEMKEKAGIILPDLLAVKDFLEAENE